MATPAVADVIGLIESDNNDAAMRFEFAMYQNVNWWAAQGSPHPENKIGPSLRLIQSTHHCSNATAAMIAATSWGRYQLMGFNLYGSLTYPFTVARFLASPLDQTMKFEQFLKGVGLGSMTLAALASSRQERERFAKWYNGPGNVAEYAVKIAQAVRDLGCVVS